MTKLLSKSNPVITASSGAHATPQAFLVQRFVINTLVVASLCFGGNALVGGHNLAIRPSFLSRWAFMCLWRCRSTL